jgi:hypothetical protein
MFWSPVRASKCAFDMTDSSSRSRGRKVVGNMDVISGAIFMVMFLFGVSLGTFRRCYKPDLSLL